MTLEGLVTLYQLQGNYSQAETYARQTLAGRRHSLGPQHPGTLLSENSLALALVSQSKYAEAEPLAREVLELDKKTQSDDWERYWAASLLGKSLAGQKKYDEGEPLLREGYQGMNAREQLIAASDRYNLDITRKWLDHHTETRGKQKPPAP
jgi:eukaryotic-like serine/threonine-protein kinase